MTTVQQPMAAVAYEPSRQRQVCPRTDGKWSARRTLAFIVISSLLLWGGIIGSAVLIATACFDVPASSSNREG